ncbi:DUF4113 domain-containing protein [Crenothrix polyspora]|uniref:DUF4113 domain-containing protein n=1 Tax=Crenothrix polyspora TaxID=360316 RepID=UPI00111F8933
MDVIDRINRRFAKAVSIATTGFDKTWNPWMKRWHRAIPHIGGSWFGAVWLI